MRIYRTVVPHRQHKIVSSLLVANPADCWISIKAKPSLQLLTGNCHKWVSWWESKLLYCTGQVCCCPTGEENINDKRKNMYTWYMKHTNFSGTKNPSLVYDCMVTMSSCTPPLAGIWFRSLHYSRKIWVGAKGQDSTYCTFCMSLTSPSLYSVYVNCFPGVSSTVRANFPCFAAHRRT